MENTSLRQAIVEAQAEAALGGHQLDPFAEVENGYQVTCTLCGITSWVGFQRLRYSLLEDECGEARRLSGNGNTAPAESE